MTDFATLVLAADTRQLTQAQRAIDDVAKSGERAEKQTNKTTGAFGNLNRVAPQTRKSVDGIGLGFSAMTKAAGAAAASLATLAAAAVSLGVALRDARQFGAAIAEVTTLMGDSAAETALLEKNARALGVAYGTGAIPQVKAFYQAISAGAGDVAEASKLLDQANKLAIGGATDVTTAVDILTTATNVYRDSGLSAADASDALFVAMRAGKTTIGELAAALGAVLPLASNLGVSFDEVTATTAALTLGGISTAESITGLRAAMSSILGPSEAAKILARDLGLNFSAAGLEALGFAGFMEEVVAKTGGSAEAMQELFSSSEAVTVALALSGSAGASLVTILDQMETKAGATGAAFQKMSETFDQRLNRAMAALVDIGITVGNVLLTVLVPALESVVKVIQFASDNADALAIAFGTLAITQIPTMIGALSSAVIFLGTMEFALVAAVVQARALAFAMNAIPFVAVVTGVTMLYRAYGESKEAAAEFASALDNLTASQNALSLATTNYYNNVTQANLDAMQTAAEQAVQITRTALEAAERELKAASFATNFFGSSLFETERMAEAKDAIAEISAELVGAEARLSAAEHAQSNFNARAEEGGAAVTTVVTEADKLLESLNSQIVMQQAIAQHGKDSVQVAKLQAAADRAAFEEKLKSVTASETLKEELRQAFLALQSATSAAAAASSNIGEAAGDAALLAKNLRAASNALMAVMEATENLNIDTVGLKAQNLALEQGNSLINSRAAALIATKRAELQSAFGSEDAIVRAAATAEFEAYTIAVRENSAAQEANQKLTDAINASLNGTSQAATKAAAAIKALKDQVKQLNLDADPVAKYNAEINRLNKLSALGLSEDALAQAIASANDELANSIPMLNDFTSAFENVLNGSIKTFKDFAQTIFQSFRNLMAQLVATAARNRIMVSLGMGGSVAGTAASAATSGMGGAIAGAGGMAGLGSAALGGAGFFTSGVASGFAAGGIGGAVSGGGTAIATALSGASGGLGGLAAAAGAVALPLLAVAAVVTFFRTKTKELDSGLNVTVKNMDTLVQSFRTVQKSRFWGLSKRVSTTIEDASDGIANPIIDAVSAMQESAINAAAALGVSANAFAGFSHEFNLSLKGLNEQRAMQKVSEELGKMGDAFASLVPGVQSLNELLQVAEQRFQLENRLMQLQGNEAELLVRMREREMNATHALNQSLLSQIHAIEDAQRAAQQQLANAQQAQQAAQQQLANAQQAVTNAFAGLRRAIDAEKDSLRDGFTNVIDAISKRLKLANEAAKTSENIFSALNRALRDRRGQNLSDAMFAQRRVSALAFLQSQQGMQVTDEAALNDALGVVAEPSAKLFRNFTDYQRDFAKTTMLIDELQSVAEFQLSADERAVVLLEEQRTLAESQFETQMLKLDNQLASLDSQYNALMGIDDSVKTVADAVRALNGALGALGAAQVNNNAVKSAEDKRLALADAIAKYKTDKNFNFLNLSGGDSKLLELANLAGVSTAGRTGQNIAEDIASATQMILQVDKATRAKRFAAGGVHDGGMRIVGERGPELEMTGPSQIFSHADTMKMMSNAPIVLELRKLQREMEQMRQEQRQLGIQTASSTDRSYRLLRSWDVIGLPEERTA